MNASGNVSVPSLIVLGVQRGVPEQIFELLAKTRKNIRHEWKRLTKLNLEEIMDSSTGGIS